ncbi:MAG: lipooligosaccharide transport system permease protein [Actinomycetota bacterium]|nr:lipooligosaccharide transport system permease protein [Actinomycetota bacterium]
MTALAKGLARLVVIPAGAGMSRAVLERNLVVARRYWVSILSGFVEPVLYLFSLGIGLGSLVGQIPIGDGRVVGYAEFVAPALLAASAMNGAIYDSTFAVFWKIKYGKIYEAQLATPLGPRDVALGEVAWAQLRGGLYAAMFVAVMLLAGFLSSWWALLALPAAVVVGVAFAGAGMAATTFMKSWQDFDLVNLAILPMFLFSATFYPLSAYPEALQWVVRLTPLYHGVSLLRSLTLGTVGWALVGHLLYLVVMGVVGLLIAARRLERLLLT